MQLPQVLLQKGLHLPDICRFAVNQFLGDSADPVILPGVLMKAFEIFYHTFCIVHDHHIGDFGVTVSVGDPYPVFSVRKEPDSGIQFRQIPAPLGSNDMGFAFDGIQLTELAFQCLAESRPHAGIQNTADPDLAQLYGFQNADQHVSAVIHFASPQIVCAVSDITCKIFRFVHKMLVLKGCGL